MLDVTEKHRGVVYFSLLFKEDGDLRIEIPTPRKDAGSGVSVTLLSMIISWTNASERREHYL